MGARAKLHGEGPEAPPTPQPELFSLEEEPGGVLPALLSEVAGRQGKVERHIVEDLGLHRWCRSSIFLCRSWWTTWWMPCGFRSARCPCRISKCPRFSYMSFLLVPSSLSRRRRNSWWKCRPCCLQRASLGRSPSRSSTLLLLRVVASGLVKVFSQNRVQQQRLLLWNAFLSGLWSRSLTFLLLGGGLGHGSSSSAGAADEDFTGFFALFPMEKSAECRAGG